MLYYFLVPLASEHIVFNVFRYLTFRSFMALISALVISLVIGPWVISTLREAQHGGDTIREDTPERHRTKKGTPTMGGIIILAAIVGSTILWANLRNRYVWVVVLATIGFGLIGVWDDMRKLRKRKGVPRGRSSACSSCSRWPCCRSSTGSRRRTAGRRCSRCRSSRAGCSISGWLWIPFAMLVIVGASNAVNLTDGLDGLAIGPVIMAGGAFGVIAYLTGNFKARRLPEDRQRQGRGRADGLLRRAHRRRHRLPLVQLPPRPGLHGRRRLARARRRHRDARGASRRPSCSCRLIGGFYVVEAGSVIIQVASFKLTGKRVFRMAPLHHHYELAGWSEPKIVVRFWIVSFALALLALTTLKLR